MRRKKKSSGESLPSFHKEGWPEGPGWFGLSVVDRMTTVEVQPAG
jgi:hypothetical protein